MLALIFIALCVIAYILYKKFNPTPAVVTPNPNNTATPPPVPLTLDQKVWKGLKFLAIVGVLFILLFSGLFVYFANNDGGSQSSQSFQMRDNNGVVQMNDIDITNNNTTVVQPVKKVIRVVETVTSPEVTEEVVIRRKTKNFKRSAYNNEDPPAIKVTKRDEYILR